MSASCLPLDKLSEANEGNRMMNPWFQVALGGAFGALGRYAIGRALPWDAQGWPLHTFVANVIGGLLMGGVAGVLQARGLEAYTPLLMTGVLGGFTTFSAFSLETWTLFEQGQGPLALCYVFLSVIGAIAAVAGGLFLARFLS